MKWIPVVTSFFCGILLTLAVVGFTRSNNNNDGYILEREKDIAKEEPGSHNGGGLTTGYSFFSKLDDLQWVLRKRTLRPGSSIGYHLQKADEIYYIVGGKGEMNVNGKTFPVGAGDAVLTRPGNWHGLKPVGNDSVTLIINYLK